MVNLYIIDANSLTRLYVIVYKGEISCYIALDIYIIGILRDYVKILVDRIVKDAYDGVYPAGRYTTIHLLGVCFSYN